MTPARGTLVLAGLAWCLLLAVVVVRDVRPGGPDPPLLPTADGIPLRLAVIGVAALGLALWRWWPRTGAVVGLVAGALAGALLAFEVHPALAAAGGGVLVVVALVLMWGAWTRRPARAAALGAGALVLASAASVAAWGYGQLYGGTHPSSQVPGPPAGTVTWVWSGGVTAGRAVVTARAADDDAALDLRVSPAPREVRAERRGQTVRFTLTGLDADTAYDYAVTADGRDDGSGRGTFRTPPVGPASFSVVFSSCARTGSNGRVFDAIRERSPLLYLTLGDLYYANIDRNDPDRFRAQFDRVLTRPAQANLARAVATDYIWDDHDFGPNDADATSVAAPAAHAVYREAVPHHPLSLAGPTAPLAHAFTIGRARFVVTDTRSARSPSGAPDGPSKTMLGRAQLRWFTRELVAARGRGELVVWVNPVPWIGEPRAGADGWAGYATERRAIADFIVANDITALVMLSGDTHALAIDDGTNSGYASNGARGFPVAHGGALDRTPRIKGGPYSHGVSAGGGRYATLDVSDGGGPTVTVSLAGWDWRGERLLALRVPIALPARPA